MTAIYAARWIVPIVSPPIENGAVAIAESEIIAVGQKAAICRRFPDANLLEFGEAAILPGFVNAHSHLELTVMRGFHAGADGND
jgi:cytosine/adenosine deaminase-related metal-dependent hydrolase